MRYHLHRTTIMLLAHSLLPLVYLAGLEATSTYSVVRMCMVWGDVRVTVRGVHSDGEVVRSELRVWTETHLWCCSLPLAAVALLQPLVRPAADGSVPECLWVGSCSEWNVVCKKMARASPHQGPCCLSATHQVSPCSVSASTMKAFVLGPFGQTCNV